MSSSSSKHIDDDRFDGLYLNVANQARGIEPVLDTLFSFLRRKTDFFSGLPSSGSKSSNIDDNDNFDEVAIRNKCQPAIDKVNTVLNKHIDLYIQSEKEKFIKNQKVKASKKPKTTTTPTQKSSKEIEQENVVEMSGDGGFDISSSTSSPITTSTPPSVSSKNNDNDATTTTKKISTSSATKQEDSIDDKQSTKSADKDAPKGSDNEKDNKNTTSSDDQEEDDSDDKAKELPPVGNGGTVTGKYTWTQILSEVVVSIIVPENTRGRDLDVIMTKNKLKVSLRKSSCAYDTTTLTNNILLDGELCKSIICDDSFWTVEDNNQLVINLQKLNTMEWWDCIIVGHPTINVQAIQPENSSLNDLDGETRTTVEKMMFDQRQKALGLPSSDEQNKLNMLQKFQLQHPELDFSNAKIS